ncbi:MAG TPA: DUF5916 domain-containing protein, partial [Kofleriaceae bacterium]|nr:DUF5916 domain-containing protein [Kofleriaceae bacterium]
IFSLYWFIQSTVRGLSTNGTATLNIRPASNIELDVISDASWTYGDPRLVGIAPGAGGARTYLFQDRDSRSWDILLRGTWTFSPSLSLQVYGQLFLDSGHYGQATTITGTGLYPRLDVKDFQPAAMPTGTDNDFRDSALNVNAFFRWEFLPGSALWLVYTRNQGNLPFDPAEGVGRLRFDKLNGPSTDVFLVKLSYLWEPLKSR